ncbi:MAG: hypothetical protein H6626_00395 [Pseudobdellovibrionaceae bacterium]|nr:hypothetical protein [Bdellovibrionales bacterium]USN47586.1 MAG: hypothetical protein H6626_00395 [Pseudobdellovibrionaceae bacterium]
MLKSICLLFSAVLAAGASESVAGGLSEKRVRFSPLPLPLTEPAAKEWVTAFKNQANAYMMRSNSDFGKALNWYRNFSDYDRHLYNYHVQVRPVEGLNNVYVALFYSRLHMNKSLIRPSLFQDGGPGVEVGHVAKGNELFYHESIEAARGLNLRRRDLIQFAKATGGNLLPEEQMIYNHILPILNGRHRGGDYFLIGLNVVGFALDTLGHEIAHALFDSYPAYKNTIKDFWQNTLTESDREEIRNRLAFAYEGEDVIIDEFQAYLLQPKVPVAQSEVLEDFAEKYSHALVEKLNSLGLPNPTFGLEPKNRCGDLLKTEQ